MNLNVVGCRKPYPEPVSLRRLLGEAGLVAGDSLCSMSFLKYSGISISVIENKRVGGDILARSKFQSEKRQKEVAKKKKQEEKRQRKLEKNTVKPDDNPDPPQDAAESSSAEGSDVILTGR